MIYYVKMSAKIYDDNNFSAYRRSLVFIIRSMVNYKKIQELREFLHSNALRRDILSSHPAIYEQATRCIFYRGSTFSQRMALIKEHLFFFENKLTQDAIRQIYMGKGITIWESDYHGESISLELCLFHTYYREGMMGLVLKIGGYAAYTVTFWVELNKKGEPVLKIGALQGTREGLRINREITKYFFGYRPKNFILFGLRTIAEELSIKQIFAVSDYGYYANNHIRLNRKLKTSLDIFWNETGGSVCDDPRFFELPIIEPRKTIDEVVSHKRNYYRKRFALLDEIGVAIKQSLVLHSYTR
ncbi:hypothetical protein SRRS_53360 [Sporomusa rhizae]|uniref:VirK/YbjX family protein n=1 Tax=Sporomusa rhizae TaxID=357999 RepID=UPI00352B7514